MSTKKNRKITFIEAINECILSEMSRNKNIVTFGLGINDPKRIFGSTKKLVEKFGEDRVFDVPTSENALTGIGLGLSLGGKPVLITHQRADFFLLAFDQLINSISKWNYMFDGNSGLVNVTIRLIVGRGWGQGPTHSQNLQSVLSHFPGLKVVIPTTPYDAKGLLASALRDPNPVIFLEHRWLHNSEGIVPSKDYLVNLNKSKVLKKGKDLTVISTSYMTPEIKNIYSELSNLKIDIEHIDLICTKPLDKKTILNSVKKTGRVVVLDSGFKTNSISAEIITIINEKSFKYLKSKPMRITVPDVPEPASYGLTKYYYPNKEFIVKEIADILRIKTKKFYKKRVGHHDVPGKWFEGPF
jgi:acetoin:2,6-dichlorophenolindophenol oxidoreductase subunit beta